jgi:hypothetical protein
MSERITHKDFSPEPSIGNFFKLFRLMAENPGANTELKPRPQTNYSDFTPEKLIGAFFGAYNKPARSAQKS